MEHPGRHEWSRRRLRHDTVPRVEDWVVLRRGWIVGRVREVAPGFHRAGDWSWAVQTYPASHGYAGSLEEALERVREGVSLGPDGLPNLPAVGRLRMARRPVPSPGDDPGSG